MFSEAVEDRPSPEGSGFFVSFLSVSMNVIPLACLGLDFPTVHFPVCVFAFFFCCLRIFSGLLLLFSSYRIISYCGAFGCSSSKKRKHE